MAKGGKITKGGKNSPEKDEPPKNGGPPPTNGDSRPEDRHKELPPEEVKPSASSIPDSNVAAMLQGQGFVIVNSDRIKNTDGLSAETQATILDKLTADQKTMCRACLIRLEKTYAKLEISGEFGQWLTANGSNDIHVRVPISAYYDPEDENPLDAMQPRKSNVAMSIREELRFQIEEIVKASPDAASCTDINRLLLMVEEMEITHLPLQSDGRVD